MPQEFKANAEEAPENENSADSPADSNDTNQTPSPAEDNNKAEDKNDSEQKDRGLADDPRWQEREDDWKKRYNEQEERQTEEMSDLRKELEDKYAPKPKAEDSDIPEWSGMDAENWKKYQKYQKEREDFIRKETRDEINSKSDEERKGMEEATAYANTEIDGIEKDKTLNPDGKEIDRNLLMKFVLDNNLIAADQRWNYKLGFELLKARGQVPTTSKNLQERKNLAGETNSGNSADPAKPFVTTSEELRKDKPW